MSRGPFRALTLFMAALLFVGPVGAVAPAGFEILTVASPGPTDAKGSPVGSPGESKAGSVAAVPGSGRAPVRVPLGQGYVAEVEPNGTFGTATPLGGTNLVAEGNIFPNGDLDWFSFTAAAGDRLYAAVMTSFSASANVDSQLRVFAPDGTTLIELDDNDGSFGTTSSTLANVPLTAGGTYFLEVRNASATAQLRPYELHVRVQSGAPTAEVEPNDTPATANLLPASGWVSGARNPAVATEQDWFSFTAAAGDTVYLSLDLDPERDNVQWNGRLGIGLFGDANNQILVVDDASAGSVANPLSEALFMSIKTAGTYFGFVDSATAATGGPTATYTLSISIHPSADEGVNCTTYTSTDVPQTIPTGPGSVSSTLTVPGNPRIADLDLTLTLNHAFMADLDFHLRSPAGNDNGVATDIGSVTVGGQQQMDVTFDDEAGLTPAYTTMRPQTYKPELNYRLGWFDGEDAGGTWTLDIRDDATGDGGTLTAWSLRICEPPPPPACATGFTAATVFTTDFEAGDAGFTHSGAIDEWERGLPATVATTTSPPVAAFNSCNSGTNCWKTDLDNTYNAGVAAGSPQDLLSPPIDLAGFSPPVVVRWAQRYQIESATFDRAFVDYQQVGGATPVRLWEHLDATMTNAVGNPTVNIGESAGWGLYERRADSLAGFNTELHFNLTADNSVQLGGLAVDDVSVTACRPLVSDLSITKTNGVSSVNPGSPAVYTIVASNAGPDPNAAVTVADTFPAALTGCTWTCVGAGGGTCTAAGAGNINDLANLPAGGSATYTATCTVAGSATGILSNTATVAGSGDPNSGNNSATDNDTVNQISDLSITKTDGLINALPGQATTYTIVASNAGPSGDGNAFVEDNFPAAFTGATWTCVGAGGGTCTAAGAGNIADTVNLPAGASVTYTVNGTINIAFTGTLTNTATVALAGPAPPVPPFGGPPAPTETDPNPANNSATDNTEVGSPGDVTATKSVAGDFQPGGAITYTIVLTNNGAGTQLDNPGDEFTDVVPPELTVTGTGASSGTAGAVGNTVSWNGSIPGNGGTVTVTIDATVNDDAQGVISNQGTVNFDADGDGTNESSGVTDDPVPDGTTDPTDFEIVLGAPAIPTLSTWGLMLMALALLMAGWVAARRRRSTL